MGGGMVRGTAVGAANTQPKVVVCQLRGHDHQRDREGGGEQVVYRSAMGWQTSPPRVHQKFLFEGPAGVSLSGSSRSFVLRVQQDFLLHGPSGVSSPHTGQGSDRIDQTVRRDERRGHCHTPVRLPRTEPNATNCGMCTFSTAPTKPLPGSFLHMARTALSTALHDNAITSTSPYTAPSLLQLAVLPPLPSPPMPPPPLSLTHSHCTAHQHSRKAVPCRLRVASATPSHPHPHRRVKSCVVRACARASRKN
eukprot:358162-Chlamydomonas_euryale.AAC.6